MSGPLYRCLDGLEEFSATITFRVLQSGISSARNCLSLVYLWDFNPFSPQFITHAPNLSSHPSTLFAYLILEQYHQLPR